MDVDDQAVIWCYIPHSLQPPHVPAPLDLAGAIAVVLSLTSDDAYLSHFELGKQARLFWLVPAK